MAFEQMLKKFDPSTWTEKELSALHGPILFGFFANIVCLYYFYKMYKKRADVRFKKHMQIRHSRLLIAHLVIAWYWVAIHSPTVFIMNLFNVSWIIGYCYGYFMVFFSVVDKLLFPLFLFN